MEQVQAQGKGVLVLIWDNASWHVSKQVKTWLRQHNQTMLQEIQTEKVGVPKGLFLITQGTMFKFCSFVVHW